MMNDKNHIYIDALNNWGHSAQMDVTIEELSELIKAIIKHRRNPTDQTAFNIAEEVGDVYIMLKQVEIAMTRNYPDFPYWENGSIQSKLRRVENALKN